jgi:hypothetical protein
MWRGRGSRRSRRRWGARWCEEKGSGEALFIVTRGCCGCPWRSSMAWRLRCAKRQGSGRVRSLASWRCLRASWRRESETRQLWRCQRLRGTVAGDDDHGDGDNACADQWGYPGGSRWCGDRACEGRRRGEDGCDGASVRTGASSGVLMRTLARLCVLGASGRVEGWSGQSFSGPREGTGVLLRVW